MQNNKRLAFTLTELITACAILTGIAVFLINTKMANQTAEREAARVLEWINKLTQTANRTHQAFSFEFNDDNITMQWNNESYDINPDESLNATSGCKYSPNKKFVYTLSNIYRPSGTITITGTDESKYYIIFSTRGRARISADPANNDDDE
ncbi:MAG: hypothetical protein IJS99_03570 [Synergistaceae bacterium]|nr:hypothetical protein [Synergistaceae bacterium]